MREITPYGHDSYSLNGTRSSSLVPVLTTGLQGSQVHSTPDRRSPVHQTDAFCKQTANLSSIPSFDAINTLVPVNGILPIIVDKLNVISQQLEKLTKDNNV